MTKASKQRLSTGSGDRTFSAGADIHEMAQLSDAYQDEDLRPLRSWTYHLATGKKPTITAVNGLACCGGALMASLVDIRLGCERTSSSFLSTSYGRVDSTWTLPPIVGWPMAEELIFTVRVVETDEALRIGLPDRLCNSSDLRKGAIEVGQAIAANNPETVQGIKEIMIRDIGLSWQEMMLDERDSITETSSTSRTREFGESPGTRFK